MHRRPTDIRRDTQSYRTLYNVLFICLATQVNGGSLYQSTDTTSGPSDCTSKVWVELYPGAGLPSCINGTWVCPYEGQCETFTIANYKSYNYFCGPCGGIGSRCDPELLYPAACVRNFQCNNGWCQCNSRKDYEVAGLCQVMEPVSLSSDLYIMVITLIVLLILNKLIKSGKYFSALWNRGSPFCRCRWSADSESEESVVGVNERAGEKTASYTMTNNEFMATSDDPDLEWALELSRIMREPNGEWIEGTASVRPRPSNSNRTQPSGRRSVRYMRSNGGTIGRTSQPDGASVRPRPSRSTRSQSPDRSSMSSMHSINETLGASSQPDGASVKSLVIEDSTVTLQFETKSIAENSKSVRGRLQMNENTPSTSTSEPFSAHCTGCGNILNLIKNTTICHTCDIFDDSVKNGDSGEDIFQVTRQN
ncbi:unnamed protein product, partial [Meganyctiphanes norvegica]